MTPDGIERRTVVAAELGLATARTEELAGGEPVENARLVEAVLAGERGPRRDVVLLNAGAAFVVAGRADRIPAGIALAAVTIDDGAAAALLARLRDERREAEPRAAAATAATATTDREGAPA